MAGFPIEVATRIKTLPPYLFAAIDKMKQAAIARGVDIINLGIGDPDLPTPAPIIDSLAQAAKDPKRHQYPSYEGMLSFRTAVADWYKRRFNVSLTPADEVLALIGSKEGIGHIHLAFVDPGDIVLVPSPGYPVYPVGTSFCGGVSHIMPLTKANGFLPDLSAIPKVVAQKAKLMWLNSPNNPTSVIMTKDYFKRVVEFAQEHQVIVCHDAAYSEIYYDGKRPASFLEVDGAKDVGTAADIDEAHVGDIDALLEQQRPHDLVQLRAKGAHADDLARKVLDRLDLGLGREHGLLAGDAGAADDLHLGAPLDRRQRLIEAGEDAHIAVAADQRADDLRAVADRQDFRVDAQILQVALGFREFLDGGDLIALG